MRLTEKQKDYIKLEVKRLEKLYKWTKDIVNMSALNGRIQGMYEVITLFNNYKEDDKW